MGNAKQDRLWTKFENHLLNEGLTDLRRKKLYSLYGTVQRGLKGRLGTADRAEIEPFINALNRGEFRKINGKPYGGATKSDLKKFLRQFYKWYKGDNEYYPKAVSWVKTKIPKQEKVTLDHREILSKEDAVKLALSFKKAEYRALVFILFDSGFRISEALSIKKKDLSWESFYEDQPENKCFWVACNESKTVTRKIPIPLFTEELRAFLNTEYIQAKNDNEPIFPFHRSTVRKALDRGVARVFTGKNRKRITPHTFRRSSLTHYAVLLEGNLPMLSERYGAAEETLKVYIRKTGVYQKPSAKKVFSNEVTQLREEVEQLRLEMKDIREWLREAPDNVIRDRDFYKLVNIGKK